MNRTSDRKKVSRECPICGETMEMDPWAITLSNKHYEQTHLEYQKWLKRWTRELLLIGLLGVLTLALSLGLFFPCGITCQSNPFERDWREGQGIVQTFGNTSEDEQILHLTGELCHQLNTPKLVPKKIFWKDVVQVPIAETSANIEMPSDLVSTGKSNIVLPKRMQGVLTIEEWKPIIASSLIFMQWIRPKMVRTIELSVLGVLGYAVVTFLLLQHFGYGIYSYQGLALHPAILLTLGVALFVITGRYFSPEARQELLRADQKAQNSMEKTRLFVRFRRSIAWALQTCKSWRKRRSDQCTTSRAWQRGLKTSNNSPFRVDKSKLDTKCRKELF